MLIIYCGCHWNVTDGLTRVLIFTVGQIQALPVTASEVETATRQDPVLSKGYRFVKEGWLLYLKGVRSPRGPNDPPTPVGSKAL